MTAPSRVQVEQVAPGVVRVLLDREHKRNVIDQAMRQAFIEALTGRTMN